MKIPMPYSDETFIGVVVPIISWVAVIFLLSVFASFVFGFIKEILF